MNGSQAPHETGSGAKAHDGARCAAVFSIGSINADFQVRVERRPEISETLVVRDFRRFGGGKAANVAFLVRKLGADARLFGHVGDDDLARQALGPLRGIGVDLSGVREVIGMDTGFAMITVPPDGKKGIVMAPNVNHAWSDEDGDRLALALREAPPGSLLVADCEVAPAALEQAMRTARQCNIETILDPSPADRVTDSLLALTGFVIPNSGEAERLTGSECKDAEAAVRAGRRLRERGASAACIRLPDGGCIFVDGTQLARFSSVPVDVVDTTGAGDAFAGALAVALRERRPRIDAVRFAVAAATLAVTGFGAQASYPDREEIESMERRLEVNAGAG